MPIRVNFIFSKKPRDIGLKVEQVMEKVIAKKIKPRKVVKKTKSKSK